MHSPKDFAKQGRGQAKQAVLRVDERTELMKFLMEKMPDKSRSTIKSLLAHHQVSVDYAVTTQFNHPLKAGQQVMINWTKVQQSSPRRGLTVVFEDPHILVIEKQAGLLSIATDKEKQRTVYRILSDQAKKMNPDNRIFVVHRLDREASGLMIFAKSRAVQQSLQHSGQKTAAKRTYVAVVEGSVTPDEGAITSWLKENQAHVVYSSQIPGDGLRAETRYRVLRKNNDYTLLEIKPETERKNQVRVHLKDLGHCITGDRKYGSAKRPIDRMALHARVLTFRHPVTNKDLRFETPIPGSFLRLFPGPKG